MEIEHYFREKKETVDRALSSYLPESENHINDVMRYCVVSEGKRFRPILILATVEALGKDCSAAIPAACAMELVHCFSLVHDDLPCMDDDDYRRGRPACHKKYSEAQALLSGDALLAYAFEILADGVPGAGLDSEIRVRLLKELSRATGMDGMIGGQFLECIAREEKPTEESLLLIHRKKTGALIRGSVRIGAILGGAGEKDLQALTEYGEAIGLLFQIGDDIIDAGIGGEQMSFSTFYGIEGARQKAAEVAGTALSALRHFSGKKEILGSIVDFLLNRER